MADRTEVPEMITIRQAAQRGPFSEYTLRLLHKQGKLPCVELPRKTLVNYTALIEWLQSLADKM